MSQRKQLTKEQLALSNERKRKRAQLAATNDLNEEKKSKVVDDRGRILQRRWLQDEGSMENLESWQQVKLMTWNVGVCLFALVSLPLYYSS